MQKNDFLRATRAPALPSVSAVPWPPKEGELLPRASEAVGIRRKLADYSLDLSHQDGGPKAHGFVRILGITLQSIDHLETEIKAGILVNPIAGVRNNSPHGFSCVVEFPIWGVGARHDRVATLRTIWELTEADSPPRLVTAFLRP